MFVLGIDPGLSRCGYAGVDAAPAGRRRARRPRRPAHAAGRSAAARLAELRAELAALIAELRPDVVVVEHVFFQVNVRTAMSVGQASGLALAEAAAAGCEVVQYTPNQVKEAVAGYGAADKAQVQTHGAGPARPRRAAPPARRRRRRRPRPVPSRRRPFRRRLAAVDGGRR